MMERGSRRCLPGQCLVIRGSWPILRPGLSELLALGQPRSLALSVVFVSLNDLDMSGDWESETRFEIGSCCLVRVSKEPLGSGN
jgi:hypothetical protein